MKFKIDSKAEAKNLPHLVNNLAGEGILIESLKNNFSKYSEKEIYLEVKKLHKGNKKKFTKIKSTYKKIWKNIGPEYIEEMEKITNSKLNKNKTIYFVPSIWVNIADVLGRKNVFIVAEEIQQNPLDFILLHELTHIYYSDIVEKLKLSKALTSSLIEGIDHLILYKSPIKELFSKPNYKEINFVKSNPKFMKELEKIWEERKNFESFLKEAIKINKKFKGVKIC